MKLFEFCLYALFAVTYFQGLLLIAGISDFVVKFSTEALILLLFLQSLRRLQRLDKPTLFLITGYLFTTALSAYVHDVSLYTLYRYFRYTIYSYLILIVVESTPIPPDNVRKINLFIISLFCVQVIASFVKKLIFKGSWEGIVGTTSITGGAHATILPLFAMVFGLAFYLYYRRSLKILLATLAFLSIGYASNKRGIWLYTPPLLMLEYIIFMARERKVTTPAHVVRFAAVLSVVLLIAGAGLLKIMEKREAELGYKPDLAYALSYSMEYSEGETSAGFTIGRIATSRRTFYALTNGDFNKFVFGWGPGSLMGTGASFEPLSILYGIVGWARDAISIGWMGMILFVLYYFRLWFRVRRAALAEKDPYWRAFSFGTFIAYFVFVIDHFTYGTVFAEWGILSYVLAYATAIVVSPRHRMLRKSALTKVNSPLPSRLTLRFA